MLWLNSGDKMKEEKKRKLAKKNQRRLKEMQRRFEGIETKMQVRESSWFDRLKRKVRAWMTK